MKGLRSVANIIGISLAIISIVHELRLPASERRWHGTLFGYVPYDWRVPTVSRVVNTFWQPESPTLLRPTVFGVGWGVNLAALLRPFLRAE
jgi:hypothetical protein